MTTFDGLGRKAFSQKRRAPGSSNFDSVQYTYGWTANVGSFAKVSMPYLGTQAQSAPAGTAFTTTQNDPIGRTLSVVDGGSGYTDYSYTLQDALVTVGPAPSGENTKQRQMQYDGLGRLTSVCEITSGTASWPGGSCGQASSATGYLTNYGYDPLGNLTNVSQNLQSTKTQTRSFTYDGLSRMTSETNPESGTTTYIYSSAGLTDNCYPGGFAENGDLHQVNDANGSYTCYIYDSLHRLTDVGNSAQSTNPCKRFRYDSAANGLNPAPSGYSTSPNATGRLIEAATNCGGASGTITDEWFSYDADGRQTDLFESTPNSGGYYHPTEAYWANGGLKTLWISTLPAISYGADGEGRTSTVSASSGQNPVTATAYNASSQVTGVTLGSGDTDAFTYDPKTGRMTQYKYTTDGASETGTPTWNPIGSLKSLAIADPFNSGDNQTCNYAADDLSRISSVNCGSAWSQTFTYDPFGNITKTGSIAWQPGYTANNRYSLSGTNYDSDGNLLNDSFHAYTWNVYGRPSTIDSVTRTYDALDRLVEQNISGTNYQVVYTPTGDKMGVFKSSTIQQLYVPLPGGVVAEYYSWGLSDYRHSDWLGSDRLESSYQANVAPTDDNAYAPFGEPYAQSGNGEISFTGQNKDTVWLQYDFMNRQYDPKQGRWISPDPAGLSAVDINNPQSWNRYAYVANAPLFEIDASGLGAACPSSSFRSPGCNIAEPGDFRRYNCIQDGMYVPCTQIASLMQFDEFAFLIAQSGQTRHDKDTGQLEQVVGWQVRNVLNLNGDAHLTWVKMWSDYISAYVDLNSILDFTNRPVLPEIRAIRPAPKYTWNDAYQLCYTATILRMGGGGSIPSMGGAPGDAEDSRDTQEDNTIWGPKSYNPVGTDAGNGAGNGAAEVNTLAGCMNGAQRYIGK